MSVELVMPSNHLILCHPLLLLPSVFPSIRVFSNQSVLCIRWLSIGVSASASVLLMNIQNWLPLGWTSWISLLSKELSRVFSNTIVQKHHSLPLSFLYGQHSHPYMITGKTKTLTRWTFVDKVMSMLLSMLFRLVITFSSQEKASFYFKAEVTICSDFGAPKNKVSHCFHCLPIYLPWSDGTRCHDLTFLNVEL